MMDADEIARLPREKTLPELLRDWARVLDIPSGRFVNEDLEAAADALEQARQDVDIWKGTANAFECLLVNTRTERDQARKDAKDARALLGEAAASLLPVSSGKVAANLRARIEAELRKSP